MSDPHPQGGDLFEMAKDGTKGKIESALSRSGSTDVSPIETIRYAIDSIFPADAAKPNYDHSGAESGQKKKISSGLENSGLDDVALGSTRLGEVVSASGGELPEDIGDKYSMDGGKERPGGHAPHTGRNQPTHG